MTVQRSERFDADLERQLRWYLLETQLDPVDGLALATRFAEAVDAAFEALRRNPEIGRRRFGTYADLTGTRSWALAKPFSASSSSTGYKTKSSLQNASWKATADWQEDYNQA